MIPMKRKSPEGGKRAVGATIHTEPAQSTLPVQGILQWLAVGLRLPLRQPPYGFALPLMLSIFQTPPSFRSPTRNLSSNDVPFSVTLAVARIP